MDGAPKPIDSKPGHILVVDDDPATRRMVTSYLQEHALSASSAADGRELSRHLAQGEPSLIILDLRRLFFGAAEGDLQFLIACRGCSINSEGGV